MAMLLVVWIVNRMRVVVWIIDREYVTVRLRVDESNLKNLSFGIVLQFGDFM